MTSQCPRIIPLLILVAAGCASPVQQHETELSVHEIYVAPQKVPCTGVGPILCLQTRETPDQPWQLFYGEIQGFDFRPGTEYRLRVIEEPVSNPPADSSAIRTTLDQVLEERKVSSPSKRL
ncbi:DUF4377 domain-containing protein [Paracoccus alkanivorans]|uniref:DUF4377 domain-containing protein n=1 Tax=Paracoccus alkanivorans TaxID=2116655 RepID=A0A3M0M9A6_9RHOB|nr:DUF4377 domain-containing protein [Paracoccus alkanivorans]RMC34356.1 DUF4377 domain-containing protein [Paracoccus alkanivorans]